jgi:hypothetical protein
VGEEIMAVIRFSEDNDLSKVNIGDTLIVDGDTLFVKEDDGSYSRYCNDAFQYQLIKRICDRAEAIGCGYIECRDLTRFVFLEKEPATI